MTADCAGRLVSQTEARCIRASATPLASSPLFLGLDFGTSGARACTINGVSNLLHPLQEPWSAGCV